MAKIERETNYHQRPKDFLNSRNVSIWYYFWKIVKFIKSWCKNAKV